MARLIFRIKSLLVPHSIPHTQQHCIDDKIRTWVGSVELGMSNTKGQTSICLKVQGLVQGQNVIWQWNPQHHHLCDWCATNTCKIGTRPWRTAHVLYEYLRALPDRNGVWTNYTKQFTTTRDWDVDQIVHLLPAVSLSWFLSLSYTDPTRMRNSYFERHSWHFILQFKSRSPSRR